MAENNFYINHLFEPLPVGAEVQMGQWPEHITLAGNFFSSLWQERVLAVIEDLCARTTAIDTRVIGEARFGDEGEYRVLLMDYTPGFIRFHEALAILIEGFFGSFEDPKYSGSGYQPHSTVQPAGTRLQVGDAVRIDTVTIFDINPALDRRSVLATFPLTGKN